MGIRTQLPDLEPERRGYERRSCALKVPVTARIARVLGLAFAIFLGIFAADELRTPGDVWARAVPFSMHLIPAAIVLAGLLVAWRREWIGAVLFPLLAVVYVAVTWGRFDRSVYALIAGPLVALGILFGLNWRQRRR